MVDSAPVVDPSDLAWVLVRLERAVVETAAGFRRGMTAVAALFFLMAVGIGVQGAWPVAIIAAAFGVGIVFIGKRASSRTSPEKMRPVVDAVRDTPELITLVRHYQTADSMRMFVTDWLEIRTAKHRLVVKAKDDWHRIYSTLGTRCSAAKFIP